MNMYQLIDKKKSGGELSEDEIYYIVNGYTDGMIPDYQMSAFLMAVCFRGMGDEETYHFTTAMRDSGEQLNLDGIRGVVADKHSTGGVGDKVSLVMGPMVAACGVPVAKMSGRGLGYTGGTIDKLESFAGFNTSPSNEEFIRNVNDIGIAWAGQTSNLAPADRKIYALRDVTATVDSMPLIASSIMSKKLASGADGIVLDVTYGSGAFMRTPEEAKKLAELMISIGRREGRMMSAVITSMDEPLGHAVGNAIEVKEAIDVLCGRGPDDVLEVALSLGSHMLLMNGKCKTADEAAEMLRETVDSGAALKKMAQWIERQGGDSRMVYDTELLPKANITKNVIYRPGTDRTEMYVAGIDGKTIGIAAAELGGGRSRKDEKIDLSVGIYLKKKTGDAVADGDILAVIYAGSVEKAASAEEKVLEAYSFSGECVQKKLPIYGEVYENIII